MWLIHAACGRTCLILKFRGNSNFRSWPHAALGADGPYLRHKHLGEEYEAVCVGGNDELPCPSNGKDVRITSRHSKSIAICPGDPLSFEFTSKDFTQVGSDEKASAVEGGLVGSNFLQSGQDFFEHTHGAEVERKLCPHVRRRLFQMGACRIDGVLESLAGHISDSVEGRKQGPVLAEFCLRLRMPQVIEPTKLLGLLV